MARPTGSILSVRNGEKVFGSRDSITHALAGVSFDVTTDESDGVMVPRVLAGPRC